MLGAGMSSPDRFIDGDAVCGPRRRVLPKWWSRRGRTSERWRAPPALEIELGHDIRVRIAATAPKELASAVIKALVAR